MGNYVGTFFSLNNYFFAGLTKNSRIKAPTSNTTPRTKRFAVKLGTKYKTKRIMPAPDTICTSACGFIHSLNIAFIFRKSPPLRKVWHS